MLDYAITGVGLAGLMAARDLRNRGPGVVTLEARDRVGGRVENGILADGQYVELGGQWIGAGYDAIFELIERYGLRAIGIPTRGNLVVRVHGRLLEVPSAEDGEELTPFEVADLNQGPPRPCRPAHRLAGDPAWVAANGAWLRQDLRRWTCTNPQIGGARARLGEVYEAAFGPMIPQMTLQEDLQQINSGPSLETMITNNGGLNQQRIDGGTAAPCGVLAADLGDVVRPGSVVTKVTHDETAVAILTSGETIEVRTAVSALPPRLAVVLEYDPPLPQWRQDVAEKVTPGSVIKAYLVYETPFWRERGLLGQLSLDEGVVRVTFDTTPVDSTHGLLTGFFEGNEADPLVRRPLEVRWRALVESAVRAFGMEASRPVEYLEWDRSAEQYTRGCHGVYFAPGIWASNGSVLAALNRCPYWVGAEHSTRLNGYMEGAVRSGEEVAATIAIALI